MGSFPDDLIKSAENFDVESFAGSLKTKFDDLLARPKPLDLMPFSGNKQSSSYLPFPEDPTQQSQTQFPSTDFQPTQPSSEYTSPIPQPVEPDKGAVGVRRWSNVIQSAAAKYGVPASIIAGTMEGESGGRTHDAQGNPLRSPAGAIGLMQTMPFHYKPGENPDDPETNINKGASLLADNYRKYGSWDKASAAYFGAIDGQGNITNARDAGGQTGSGYVSQFNANRAKYSDLDSSPQTGYIPNVDASGVTPNQFSLGLSDADAYAFCGPTAAIAFAKLHGRNPSAQEARQLASEVGWNPSSGMSGPSGEVALMKKMGVDAHMEQGIDFAKVQSDVSSGNPVVVDTPGHYYVIEAYDPNTKRYKLGNSQGIGDWASQEQIMSSKWGAPRNTIFADSPSSQGLSVANTANEPQQDEAPDAYAMRLEQRAQDDQGLGFREDPWSRGQTRFDLAQAGDEIGGTVDYLHQLVKDYDPITPFASKLGEVAKGATDKLAETSRGLSDLLNNTSQNIANTLNTNTPFEPQNPMDLPISHLTSETLGQRTTKIADDMGLQSLASGAPSPGVQDAQTPLERSGSVLGSAIQGSLGVSGLMGDVATGMANTLGVPTSVPESAPSFIPRSIDTPEINLPGGAQIPASSTDVNPAGIIGQSAIPADFVGEAMGGLIGAAAKPVASLIKQTNVPSIIGNLGNSTVSGIRSLTDPAFAAVKKRITELGPTAQWGDLAIKGGADLEGLAGRQDPRGIFDPQRFKVGQFADDVAYPPGSYQREVTDGLLAHAQTQNTNFPSLDETQMGQLMKLGENLPNKGLSKSGKQIIFPSSLDDIRKAIQYGWGESRWYTGMANLARDIVGDENRHEFSGLFGITSWAGSPRDNFVATMRIMDRVRTQEVQDFINGVPNDPQSIKAAATDMWNMLTRDENGVGIKDPSGKGFYISKNQSKAVLDFYKTGTYDVSSNAKAASYANNILSAWEQAADPNGTIDRWMHRLLGHYQDPLIAMGKKQNYARAQALFEWLGSELGVPTHEAQAAGWFPIKSIFEKTNRGRGDDISGKLTKGTMTLGDALDEAKARGIIGQIVGNADDVAKDPAIAQMRQMESLTTPSPYGIDFSLTHGVNIDTPEHVGSEYFKQPQSRRIITPEVIQQTRDRMFQNAPSVLYDPETSRYGLSMANGRIEGADITVPYTPVEHNGSVLQFVFPGGSPESLQHAAAEIGRVSGQKEVLIFNPTSDSGNLAGFAIKYNDDNHLGQILQAAQDNGLTSHVQNGRVLFPALDDNVEGLSKKIESLNVGPVENYTGDYIKVEAGQDGKNYRRITDALGPRYGSDRRPNVPVGSVDFTTPIGQNTGPANNSGFVPNFGAAPVGLAAGYQQDENGQPSFNLGAGLVGATVAGSILGPRLLRESGLVKMPAKLAPAQDATFGNVVNAIRYNSMLSRISTPMVNIASGALAIPQHLLTYPESAIHEVRGAAHVAADAAKLALQTFAYGVNDETAKAADLGPQFKGALGDVLNAPSRLLATPDAFIRQLLYGMELGRLAGKTNDFNGFMANPPQAAAERAVEFADRMTLKGEMGDFSQKLVELTNSNPVAKWFAPFAKTMMHITARGIDLTPLGAAGTAYDVARGAYGHINPNQIMVMQNGKLVPSSRKMPVTLLGQDNPKGAAPLDERVRTNMFGGALMAFGAMSAIAGNLSGAGPADPNKRQQLEREGWQPFSLRVGGKWVSYQNIGPMAMPLGMTAAAYESANVDTKEGQDHLSASLLEAARQFGLLARDQTYLGSMLQLTGMTQGNTIKGNAEQFVANAATSMIPFGGAISSMANATDPINRSPEGAAQRFDVNVPGLRETVPPRLDVYGQDVPNPKFDTGIVSPFKTNAQGPSPIDVQLQSEAGYAPGMPAKTIANTKLTQAQYNNYVKASGTAIKDSLSEVMSSDTYAQASTARKKQLLETAVSQVRQESGKFPEVLPVENRPKSGDPDAPFKYLGVDDQGTENKINEAITNVNRWSRDPVNAKLPSDEEFALYGEYNGLIDPEYQLYKQVKKVK